MSDSLGKDAGFARRFRLYRKHGCLVLSEDMAVKFQAEENSVLIRIKDAFFEPLKYPESYGDILEVFFADIDQPSIYDHIMTPEEAKAIVSFMDKHRDKKLVVHCQAGISRSSATACAWAYLQGIPELEEDIRSCALFCPNAHVYRLLINEIHEQELKGWAS